MGQDTPRDMLGQDSTACRPTFSKVSDNEPCTFGSRSISYSALVYNDDLVDEKNAPGKAFGADNGLIKCGAP